MAYFRRTVIHGLTLGVSLLALSACSDGIDLDLRSVAGGFDTTDAAQNRSARRPDPDDRGIISYPNFQVAVAKRGDTVADVAARVGADATELARYNGIDMGARLRPGEVIALPRRVAEPSPETGAIVTGPIRPDDEIDITTLAGNALDRADATRPTRTETSPAPVQNGVEPIRHKVVRGETAYSISRLYGVSVRSLAEWNGLGSDLTVREGQYLLVPVAGGTAPKVNPEPETSTTAPGQGSPTPTPPSASTPLPEPEAEPAKPQPEPVVTGERTQASGSAKLQMPVGGSIIRGYSKGKTDGIDIAASAGTPVRAAADGTVAAITRDTDQVPILVLRHADNLLTVYANIDKVKFQKGAKVSRGQTIAEVRESSPSFLHFEVRQGFDSVDPVPFLN